LTGEDRWDEGQRWSERADDTGGRKEKGEKESKCEAHI